MFSVSFSCIIQSLLSKFIGSVKLDYGTQWSKSNKPYSIKISGIYMHEWKYVVTIKMVNILTGSVFRNEYMYMYKDTKKICKEFEEVTLPAIPTTKITFSRCILYLMPVNFDILSANICFTHHVLYWMEIMNCLWWTHLSRSWTETHCSWPAVCRHHTGSPCCWLGH